MLFLALALCYLCGSIPFGVLVGKMLNVDVRSIGSGNIGATNVWRALGPGPGAAVFILDVMKGLAGPFIGRMLIGPDADHSVAIALCALMAVLGHTYSIFLGFKGGKGIATGLGVALGLAPIPSLITFAIWGLVLLVTRMISAASIVACLMIPVAYWVAGVPLSYVAIMALIAVVAFVKHIPNIKRIKEGTEPKINLKKSKGAENAPAASTSSNNPYSPGESIAVERPSRIEPRSETATGP